MKMIERGSPEGDVFEFWLSEIEEDLASRDRLSSFIESVREQWDERGQVSEKQKNAVEGWYSKVGLT